MREISVIFLARVTRNEKFPNAQCGDTVVRKTSDSPTLASGPQETRTMITNPEKPAHQVSEPDRKAVNQRLEEIELLKNMAKKIRIAIADFDEASVVLNGLVGRKQHEIGELVHGPGSRGGFFG
jgi:hypothetical protein